ncbi:glycosyltransferase family 2 protein [Opitutus sp. ER46]|uniref:glycosyltransferase family 2 protein n=1 Tax=Opitutus sp. ER46 TaxID=2161864 RepID=UPI000D32810B|nr:glycosyltransferase family 2 protein [Opitutus sp. ER46]PTX92590.1 hypothetical protein DB354_14785 [Opitutus sp. ER46]
MNAINATAAGEHAAFRSWVDHPTTQTLVHAHVVLRGWCYHLDGMPIRAIRARVGDRTFPGLHGDPRPDVFAAVGGVPTSERSGYELALTLSGGANLCVLEVQLANGAWHEFKRFTLHAEPPPAGDRWRWFNFWARAWLGRPSAWDRLTPDERDFVVAWVRHQGWLNLQLLPQYAPRPVTPEVFPTSGARPEHLPRLSVVTPSYQQARFLETTMLSVLDQPGIRLEYVVQDGGSTDGSAEIIRRHAARLAHGESVRDAGQADAVCRGFAHTTGGPEDVMMYLNSDDALMPGAARYVLEYFARHPDVDAVYGHRVLIDENNQEVGRWFSPRQACDDLRLHDLVPQETLFWRRRMWDRVGGINPSFQFALDWDLLLRFAAAGAKIVRLPRFLGMFRLHSLQKSQARLEENGIPEMNVLRRRTLGREPTDDEMHRSMRRAQVDSALLLALSRRGLRL